MTVLALYPRWDTWPRKDVTGAFRPEALEFARIHGGVASSIDNRQSADRMRADVLATLEAAGPVAAVAFFCHGWASGIQLGFRLPQVMELAEAIADVCPSGAPIVPLYCCSTASGLRRSAPGGDGGFADRLRDALCVVGATGCRVIAHSTAGHTTRNPWVRDFSGPEAAVGGSWLVEPWGPEWRRWVRTLRGPGDERLRFPMRRYPLLDP